MAGNSYVPGSRGFISTMVCHQFKPCALNAHTCLAHLTEIANGRDSLETASIITQSVLRMKVILACPRGTETARRILLVVRTEALPVLLRLCLAMQTQTLQTFIFSRLESAELAQQ